MARDGTVTVRITGDARGLNDALDQSDGHLSKFGGKFGGVAKGIGLGFVAMGAAAIPFGIKAVTVASDVEEAYSKVNTIFGASTGVIDKWAKDAATSIGLPRGAALAAVGDFGNMFTQLGIGTDQAAGMSTKIVDLAADFASFHNADISEVIAAQSAAFRGEYDSIQRFLPLINAATVEQKALAMTGKATTKELTAQDKALAVNTLMHEGAGKAVGDFDRTSEGLANQMRILKARGEDFMATVGTALLPIVLKGIDAFMNLGGVLKEHLGPVFETVKGVIADAAPVFEKVRDAVLDFVAKFRGGEGEIGESASKLGQIVGQIKEAFESAFAAIKAVVEVAVAVIKDIWDRFGKTLVEFMKGTWNAILEVFRAAFNIIDGIFDLIKAVLTGKWGEAWDAIKKILDGAWDLLFGVIRNALTNVIPTLFEAGKALLSAAFGLIWDALKTILSDAWDLIVRGISNAINGVVDFFVALPGRIVGAAGDLFGFIKTKIDDARQWVSDRIGDIVTYFVEFPGNLARGAGEIFQFVKTKMSDAKQWVSDRLGDIVTYFVELPGRFSRGVGNIFGFIKDSFIGAINFVIRKWNDLSFKIGGQEVFGKHLPSVTIDTPNLSEIGLAAGGIVTRPTLALLGEAGPEAVIPLSRVGSGGAGTVVNNYLTIEVSALTSLGVSEAVIHAIKEFERRNGTEWRVA